MLVRTLQVCRLLSVVALFLLVASAVPAGSFVHPTWTYRGGGPNYQTYVVRSGDTLLAIAYRFGVDVNSLMAANGLRSDRLSIGQVLRIPGTVAPALVVQAAPAVQAAPLPAPYNGPGYVVQSGDTLLAIAYRLGVSADALMAANGLPSADRLSVGQVLRVPGGGAAAPQNGQAAPPAAVQPVHDGPSDKLVPDSEAVYSPSYADFDITAFVNRYNGYLARYQESVDGDMLSGAQIVQLVAERLSVGPRVLLTMLEMEGGWVTAQPPAQAPNGVGFGGPSDSGLYNQLFVAGEWMNRAYYLKVDGKLEAVDLPDGTRVRFAAGVNPGTAAVQDLFAHQTAYDNWAGLMGPNGFLATYRRLFGDPAQYAIEPLIPADLQQPVWRVPWSDGEMWFYTGGPHAAWSDGSPRAALDFGPTEALGCVPSSQWAVAAAPGRVTASEHARVVLNLSGTSFQGNGWSLLYMHMASDGRIGKGADLKMGDHIGHPSCEGGLATGSHLHLARLYNGQWMSVDGAVPLNLSGWTFHNLPAEYDGTASRNGDNREAATVHRADLNGILGESAPLAAVAAGD